MKRDPEGQRRLRLVSAPVVLRSYRSQQEAFTCLEAEQFIDSTFAKGDELLGFRPLCLKRTVEAIGFARYRPSVDLGEDDIEFGYVIAKFRWGCGYATVVGTELIRYALEDLKLKRLLVACHPAHAIGTCPSRQTENAFRTSGGGQAGASQTNVHAASIDDESIKSNLDCGLITRWSRRDFIV